MKHPQWRVENKPRQASLLVLDLLPLRPVQDLDPGNGALTLRLSLPLLTNSQGGPPQACPEASLVYIVPNEAPFPGEPPLCHVTS